MSSLGDADQKPTSPAPPAVDAAAGGAVAKSPVMSGALEGGEAPKAGDESTGEFTAHSNLFSPLCVGSLLLTSIALAPEVKTNGTTEPGDEPTGDDTTAGPVTTGGDTKMTDSKADVTELATASGDVAQVAAPEANGEAKKADTNNSSKSNGKRKSSSGVPEHKGKKLNKKKSMPKMTHLDAQPGEYYFARLKSYPPWPSIICDEDMLPQSLLSTRPVTTKQLDGTYREAYADGGKKAHDRTFPIMFLETNEL